MGAGKIESKHHILSLKLSAFETMGQVTRINVMLMENCIDATYYLLVNDMI